MVSSQYRFIYCSFNHNSILNCGLAPLSRGCGNACSVTPMVSYSALSGDGTHISPIDKRLARRHWMISRSAVNARLHQLCLPDQLLLLLLFESRSFHYVTDADIPVINGCSNSRFNCIWMIQNGAAHSYCCCHRLWHHWVELGVPFSR